MKLIVIALLAGGASLALLASARAGAQAQSDAAPVQLAQAQLGSTGEYNGRPEDAGAFKAKRAPKNEASKRARRKG